MHDARVARRYAKALFNTAQREGVVASVDDDLRAVATSLAGNQRFRDFMASPNADEAQKLALLDKVFGDRVTALTMQAVRLMVRKGRDTDIFATHIEFSELRRRAEGVSRATITSSEELADEQKQKIVAKLENDLGHKVESEFEIDSSLIGGVKIVYDNYILDGSVRGHLDRMRDKLLYDVLKQA